MTQPRHRNQPIDSDARAADESSLSGTHQATPAWPSTGDVATYAAPAQSSLLAVTVGTLVAERYEVVEALGEGGMGLVFRAKDRKLRRDLVLKFIRPDLVHQPGMVERLYAEADAAAALNHPHVVTLYNRDSDPHGEFLIMEFVDGLNLLQLLKDAGGKLSVERAVRYIGQVGLALQAAHDAGILHRDVKPSNVLINKSDIAKLADFGLARIVEESGQTKSGAVLGTLDYMAPEQLRDARLASPQSDQFSLAAMLYQLVTGNSPMRIWGDDIPAILREVLVRALAQDHQKRFPSVADFIQALPSSPAVEAARLSLNASPVVSEQTTAAPAEPDLADLLAQTHARIEKVQAQAKALYEQRDFAQTATLLEQLPEHLRDAILHRDAVTQRDRVIALEQVIREATPAMKFDVLRPAIDELLQLQPARQDMQRLKAQIVRLTPAPTVRASSVYQAGSKAGERTSFTLDGIEYAFRWCPPGKFTMGSPKNEVGRSDDEDQVSVELTSGFWMQETTVTQAMWQAVMKTQPWQGETYMRKGPKIAATHVDWPGATEFATKLTAAARKAGVLAGSAKIVLPTEARWEYGGRAGTTTAYSFGNDAGKLEEFAWFSDDAKGTMRVQEVGQKQANPWGLLDCHGNVWEWCEDYYNKKLPGGCNPCVTVGTSRVLRGGSWVNDPSFVRCSYRYYDDPSRRYILIGFRVVVEL